MGLLSLGIRAAICAARHSEDRERIVVRHVNPPVEHRAAPQGVPLGVPQQDGVSVINTTDATPTGRLNQKAFSVIGYLTIVCSVIAFTAHLVGYFTYPKGLELQNIEYGVFADVNHYNFFGANWCGVWGAIFYAVTGALSIATAHNKKNDLVTATLVMAIVSTIVACIIFLICITDIFKIIIVQNAKVAMWMSTLILIASVVVGVSHIVLSVYCCGGYGGCCCYDGPSTTSTVHVSTVNMQQTSSTRPYVQPYHPQPAGYQPLVHPPTQPPQPDYMYYGEASGAPPIMGQNPPPYDTKMLVA